MTAWCELRGDFRSFRLDRMRDAVVLDETFEPVPGRTREDFFRYVTANAGQRAANESSPQNERMAGLPFGGLTIILDASAADTSATVGFESLNCDEDFRIVRSRGGNALEEPKDRPWGVRSAYIQGPGALKFEIEQMLPRSK